MIVYELYVWVYICIYRRVYIKKRKKDNVVLVLGQ